MDGPTGSSANFSFPASMYTTSAPPYPSTNAPASLSFEDVLSASAGMAFGATLPEAPIGAGPGIAMGGGHGQQGGDDLSRGSPYSSSPPRDIPGASSSTNGFSGPQGWAFGGGGQPSSQPQSFNPSPFDPAPSSTSAASSFFNLAYNHHRSTPSDASSLSASASPYLQAVQDVPASPALSAHEALGSHRASVVSEGNGWTDEPLPMDVEGGFASLGLDRRTSATSEASQPSATDEDRFAALGTYGTNEGRKSAPGEVPSRYDTLTWARERDSKSREDTLMAPPSRDSSTGASGEGIGRADPGGSGERKRVLSTGGLKPQMSVSTLAAALEEQRRREQEEDERRAVEAAGGAGKPSLKISTAERAGGGSGGSTGKGAEDADKMFVASPTQESPTTLETAHPSKPIPPSVALHRSSSAGQKPRLSLPKIDAPQGAGSPPLKLNVSSIAGPSISLTSATPLTARPNPRSGTLEFQRILEELARGKRDTELGVRPSSSSGVIGGGEGKGRSRKSSVASGERPSVGAGGLLDPQGVDAGGEGVGGRKMPRRQRSKSDSYSSGGAPYDPQLAAFYNMLSSAAQQQPPLAQAPQGEFPQQAQMYPTPSSGMVQATDTQAYDDTMASQFMPSAQTSAQYWSTPAAVAPGVAGYAGGQQWQQAPQQQQQQMWEMAMSMAQQNPQLVAAAMGGGGGGGYNDGSAMNGVANSASGQDNNAAVAAAAAVMANMYGGAPSNWQNLYGAGGGVDPGQVQGWSAGTNWPPTSVPGEQGGFVNERRSTSPRGAGGFEAGFLAPVGANGGMRRSHSLGGHRRNLSDTNVMSAPDPASFLAPYNSYNGMLAAPGQQQGMVPPDAYGQPPYGTAQPSAFPGYASPSYSASSPSALSAASESEGGSTMSRQRSWSHSSVGSHVSDYAMGGMGQFGFGRSEGEAGMVDWQSKTTEATKAAAKKRRKEGTEARYVCEMCGETFTRRYNLKGHQRAHKGEKPFRCEYPGCDKSFARQHDRKRHAKLHLGVKDYNCQACGKAFIRLDALQRHLRADAGQTCYQQLKATGQIPPGLEFDAPGGASTSASSLN